MECGASHPALPVDTWVPALQTTTVQSIDVEGRLCLLLHTCELPRTLSCSPAATTGAVTVSMRATHCRAIEFVAHGMAGGGCQSCARLRV